MDADEHGLAHGEKHSTGACASCHRRKLKCDRMPVCSNCKKADIPCIYTSQHSRSKNVPTTRDARRKTRGPYQKGQTVREKELEHVVEVLQKKCSALEAQIQSPDQTNTTSPESSLGGGSSGIRNLRGSEHSPIPSIHNAGLHPRNNSIPPTIPNTTSNRTTTETLHPAPDRIFELWQIYTTNVDPITKVLHCPSTWPDIVIACKTLHSASYSSTGTPAQLLPLEISALLFAVYITSLNVLEHDEVPLKFPGTGRSKPELMTLYGEELTKILTNADERGGLNFRLLQTLVIYMGCMRRQPGPGTNVILLFSLAIRSARSLGLDDTTRDAAFSPLEVQMRRRLWWSICRQESAYAEEVHTRKESIMHSADVPLPLNLEDYDLDPGMLTMPVARVGVTSMSAVLTMMEVVRAVGKLSRLIGASSSSSTNGNGSGRTKQLREESRIMVSDLKTRIEMGTLQYCDTSRPFDWFLLLITKVVLTKVEIMMLECPPETDTISFNAFHDIKVSLSLDIIECHNLLLKQENLKPWKWNYRNTQQWYATIYVLEEVARRPNADFEGRVWRVVDLVFADIELLNKHGMQVGDRDRLLQAHRRALEARERWLDHRVLTHAIPPMTNPSFTGIATDPVNDFDGGVVAEDQSSIMKAQPWQIDQSLFDIQEAELSNFADDFFWPSQ